MLKTVAIIPARLKSKRFPGKVLTNIAGKSLLRRTYDQVRQCDMLSKIIIAADDPTVMQHAQDFGAEVVMTDPSHPTGTHRVAAAVQQLALDADIVVNVQADEPCLDPNVLNVLVRHLYQHPEACITTPVSRIHDPEEALGPSCVKCVFDRQGRALYFSRAPIPYAQHERRVPYYRHLGVYCFRKQALLDFAAMTPTPLQQTEDLEQLKILEHGYPLHVCLVESSSAGVDTPEDVKKVEALLCQI
ncbi:MAG: 3-deoxy-manno-octulosonate cytidylyltransferase [Verrucomicrobia bacterium]|nr:3-deoxy-manno-octulosonate cytidylyltransferase [Verrucomicrobiota bacterium]MBS0647411.1 3-deoxy-manno-octulosonate cytidylyltransferase [Verrucomicrobiota bacterium]